ncbi:MAG: hypothetical protein JWO50_624 [Candidatus Kaiserbacteria bacterium]|nr:hypothetical protein [Candidatus Kaiserbacteria bacterium]
MNNFEEKLKTQTNIHTLSTEEKATMRAMVFKYATPAGRLVKSPLQWWAMPQFAIPAALVLLLTVVGSGTTYAAEMALPGDALYKVKINVVENIKVALAVGPKAKEQVHTQLAAERLDEARVLASEGRLDATTTAEIQSNFDEHALAAQFAADMSDSNTSGNNPSNVAVGTTSSDTGASGTTTSKIATAFSVQAKRGQPMHNGDSGLSSLITKASVLATVGDDSTDAATKNNANLLSNYVQSVIALRSHTDQENNTEKTTDNIASRSRHWGITVRTSSSTSTISSSGTASTSSSSEGIKDVSHSIGQILTSLGASTTVTSTSSTSTNTTIHASDTIQVEDHDTQSNVNSDTQKKLNTTISPVQPPTAIKSLLK